MKAASNVNEFNQTDLPNTTVGELYSAAKSQGLLSEKDSSNKTLTLRIMVVESLPVYILFLFTMDDPNRQLQVTDEVNDQFPEISVTRQLKRKLSGMVC